MREFRKLVFGPSHPYAREATIQTVSAVTRRDLRDFHAKYFHPNGMIMGIVGDFQTKEMVRKIRGAFGSWLRQEVEFPEVPPVPAEHEFSVNYIERDLTQTTLAIGHVGIRQKNPDFFALSVLNDILGGGSFASRLFQGVRTRKGLAYSVGSVFAPGKLDRGIFFCYAQTKAQSTYEAISSIIEEIKKVQREPVSEEELAQAKASFLNSFVFSFSSPARIVNRQVSLEYYGLPADYLERFRDNVAKVTQEDVQRVARKYLHPDGLVILAVGRQDLFDRSLSALGEVHTIELEEEESPPVSSGLGSIPPPHQGVAASSPSSMPRSLILR